MRNIYIPGGPDEDEGEVAIEVQASQRADIFCAWGGFICGCGAEKGWVRREADLAQILEPADVGEVLVERLGNLRQISKRKGVRKGVSDCESARA